MNPFDIEFCFLVSIGRHGSLFLQSLLDGHPEVLMIPQTFSSFDSFFKEHGKKETDSMLEAFVQKYPRYFDSRLNTTHRLGNLGAEKNEGVTIPVAVFKKAARELLVGKDHSPWALRDTLTAITFAYEMAQGNDVTQKKILVHHVHHVANLAPMISQFPKYRILSLAREPKVSLYSAFYGFSGINQYYDPMHFYLGLNHLLKDISEVQSWDPPAQTLVIRLEDLHTTQENGMRKIAQALGITYSHILSESTFYGKKWWGDAISSQERAGFSNEPNASHANGTVKPKWSGFYSKRDVRVVEFALRHRIENYEYAFAERPLGVSVFALFLFLPMKFELDYLFKRLERNYLYPGFFSRLRRVGTLGLTYRLALIKCLVFERKYLARVQWLRLAD